MLSGRSMIKHDEFYIYYQLYQIDWQTLTEKDRLGVTYTQAQNVIIKILE